MKDFTVKDLKEFIKDLPDHYGVAVCDLIKEEWMTGAHLSEIASASLNGEGVQLNTIEFQEELNNMEDLP